MSFSSKQLDDIKRQIVTPDGEASFYHLPSITKLGLKDPSLLPYSIRVLLESALRNCDDYQVTVDDVAKISSWSPSNAGQDIAFKPARVVLQDFTGVPAVVDLAALRSAMSRMGGDTSKINPQVPCDLVIDHSVQVDQFGTNESMDQNLQIEFERNKERYEFLKWGQGAFKNFRVVPPATGIVHQVNLEYLAQGVFVADKDGQKMAYPDSLVGTDSHTTMINGIGILGWGVGGIEAEAVMLGEPIYMLLPEVIGFKLTGKLQEGVTATDMVLTVTEILRKKGVVGKFVEFFGEGMQSMSLTDRATIANMAPEYGATMGYFPIDDETIRYYRLSGRDSNQVDLIEKYMKEQELFYDQNASKVEYTDVVELDLDSIEPSLAGPKRPQDRIVLKNLPREFKSVLKAPIKDRGFGLSDSEIGQTSSIQNGKPSTLRHGSVVIAAITSCTNTSNPSVMIAAGLVAKKAVEKGLSIKPFVKTSLAPGSQVVTEYLQKAGLLTYLEQLGFNIVGYGCTTCIGNSGPLPEIVAEGIQDGNLVAASVLSGNRNFEGRVNPHVKANFLASPPLVVAYALTGDINTNLDSEPIGKNKDNEDIFLKDIWPSQKEVLDCIQNTVTKEAFMSRYKDVFAGTPEWAAVNAVSSENYDWKEDSTYIQEPPFFVNMKQEVDPIQSIQDARVLVMLGDSVTTDHISPAGAIGKESPAGVYLQDKGVVPESFNSYGSRRGNDRVMTRGTFANIRLRNQLVPGSEGSHTIYFPTKDQMSIYDAAMKYKENHTPLIVLSGKEYGTGSSRDWAAKGTNLLGVKAVIAESYERIHRSNLVGMGVLPLQFKEGDSVSSLNLSGEEAFDIQGLDDNLKPAQTIKVVAKKADGSEVNFETVCRIDTPVEVDYYRNGGILQTVLRKMFK